MDTVGIGVGILGLVFFLGTMLLSLAITAFWIWMIVDCATRTPAEDNLKLIWILVIVFTGIIGALIYFFVQRPQNPITTTGG